MVFVVRHPRHDRVPGHHDQNELDAVTEEFGAAPCEPLVKVHLELRNVETTLHWLSLIVVPAYRQRKFIVNDFVLYFFFQFHAVSRTKRGREPGVKTLRSTFSTELWRNSVLSQRRTLPQHQSGEMKILI